MRPDEGVFPSRRYAGVLSALGLLICGPVGRANHGSAPVLCPRSLGGFPSSVQRQ